MADKNGVSTFVIRGLLESQISIISGNIKVEPLALQLQELNKLGTEA